MHESARGQIAVVDDEDNIRTTVSYALRRDGYQVEVYADGASAWEAFQQNLPDLAVLDISLPRMDGLELCRRLRQVSDMLPIIFLTSRDDEFDRVLGLELGADDYLCKPFSMRELQARVKVLFRRLALSRQPADSAAEKRLCLDDLELDLQRYTATWKAQALALTVTEFSILLALVRHPGHVKTRQQLVEAGYPNDAYVSDRTIDSHIKRLRKKLLAVDPAFQGIEAVYGLGYRYRQGGGEPT